MIIFDGFPWCFPWFCIGFPWFLMVSHGFFPGFFHHFGARFAREALNEDLLEPDVQVPSVPEEAWPALTALSALSRLARRPPPSALGRFSGALQVWPP